MGLATIDPHIVRKSRCLKSTPKFTNAISPRLVLIRLNFREIQRFKNVKIHKEMYSHPDAVFVNYFDIFNEVERKPNFVA